MMNKNAILVLTVILMTGCEQDTRNSVSQSSAKQPSQASMLAELKVGLSRTDAEEIIAKATNKKTAYELSAMDMSESVTYTLSSGKTLTVNYNPGKPATRGIAGNGGSAPVDGLVISFIIEPAKSTNKNRDNQKINSNESSSLR